MRPFGARSLVTSLLALRVESRKYATSDFRRRLLHEPSTFDGRAWMISPWALSSPRTGYHVCRTNNFPFCSTRSGDNWFQPVGLDLLDSLTRDAEPLADLG